jgi:dihydroorotase
MIKYFREPGLTHKGDIESESKAAIAGGTLLLNNPTQSKCGYPEILEQKYELAAQKSYANYSFMMGATNDNLEEV